MPLSDISDSQVTMRNLPPELAESGRPTRAVEWVSSYFRSLLEKRPSSGEVLVALDGLRGFAVLVVIASHTQTFGMWGQGAMGVWLFYVLSAFLLTRILLLRLPASLGRTELGKYVIRRIARILPLYYLVLIFVRAAQHRDLAWLFEHATFRKADGHFWSIPQEELFYVLLPILMGCLVWSGKLLPRIPRWGLAAALLLAVQLTHPIVRLNGNGTTLPFYLNVFSIGFFLAWLWSTSLFQAFRASARLTGSSNLVSLLVIAAIVCTAPAHQQLYRKLLKLSPPQELSLPGWEYPTAAASLCAVLLMISLKPGTWANRVFSWPPLRVLGVLSFSLYLVHPFVMELLNHLGAPQVGGLTLFLPTVVVSLAIGLLLERGVERPFMALGRRLNSRF